ncbi:phage terminase small subunit [Bacillus sp. OV166]|uniref:terminase small subunit n=1 Tax=Bacillus sp. OV166 TaxID=1882763 RepID=UPI000A2AD328|nr:terminase small subunit [Bacillus sp. OV166]SMQ75941.1 phage terminase small subunit [Bacillus sp. OV166]
MEWSLIRKEYESTAITLKALAEKYGIKLGTLKSRKSREGWSRDPTKKDATTKKKKDATIKPVTLSDELTEKQKLFCLHYLKYYNATKAYQKAYGCAYTTAAVEGHRHLNNPKIAVEINRLKAEQQQALFLDGMSVLQKYIDIAFADITDFITFYRRDVKTDQMEVLLNPDGTVKEIVPKLESSNEMFFKDMDEVDGTIISEVKKSKDGITLKLHDKMKALEKLEKYTDLLSDQQKHRLAEEQMKLNHMKYELDKRVVELREREEKTKGW